MRKRADGNLENQTAGPGEKLLVRRTRFSRTMDSYDMGQNKESNFTAWAHGTLTHTRLRAQTHAQRQEGMPKQEHVGVL